jgi:hypothetical protein
MLKDAPPLILTASLDKDPRYPEFAEQETDQGLTEIYGLSQAPSRKTS